MRAVQRGPLAGLIAVVVLVLSLRTRRTGPTTVGTASSITHIEPAEIAAFEEPPVDLETVMAEAGTAIYITIDSGRKYLAIAHPVAAVEGRTLRFNGWEFTEVDGFSPPFHVYRR